MIDRLDEIKKKALASLEAAKTDSEIEEIYISTLGRNGKYFGAWESSVRR